jgi:hypothetical protein
MMVRLFLFSLLALTVASASAQQTLFEDTFGQMLSTAAGGHEADRDFNFAKEMRQSGPLAPVDYSHNGKPWQAQTNLSRSQKMCRLYPQQTWLLSTPGWDLDSADGTYEVVFEFSHPDVTTQFLSRDGVQQPPAPVSETILAIGLTPPTGPLEALPGAGYIAVIVRTDPGAPSIVRVDGRPAGTFEPVIEVPSPRLVKIRWAQEGGTVRDIEVELDGQKIEADGGLTFAAPKVLFGARGRYKPPDYQPGDVQCLNILRLAYTKE